MLGLFIVQVTTTAEICRSCRCKSHENVDCKTNLATARGGQHNDARTCRRWLQHASQLFPSYAAKGCNKCKNFWKKERPDEIPSNILLLYALVGQCFLSTTRFWALTVCVFCSVLGTNVFVLYIFPLFLFNIVCVT